MPSTQLLLLINDFPPKQRLSTLVPHRQDNVASIKL
jgi:hypothetical protein